LIPADADVIAATSFDGRTLTEVNRADDTATDLDWTVNGIQDPGNMTVLNANGGGLALFNTAGQVTENLFAPALNTGNGNTFWTTTVNLTASSGSTVTLSDVTFDNWSINAGQNQNVNRRSDFTITLIDPAGASLDSVDIVDSLSGTAAGVPTVTATFASPIALTAPGTYTLMIKGGDFAGENETGNHTAIKNLSINGSVSSSGSFAITEIKYDPESGALTLTWDSRPGESYAVKFTTDFGDWVADLDDGIPADAGETTTRMFDLSGANLGDATRIFFRVEILPGG